MFSTDAFTPVVYVIKLDVSNEKGFNGQPLQCTVNKLEFTDSFDTIMHHKLTKLCINSSSISRDTIVYIHLVRNLAPDMFFPPFLRVN